ncbi:MAG: D-alanine--D-alanine ligase [Deltaproteobacteria bacterium]|nr:MAG: D-alanine--D-alanine ligase [Deltaproteobacteria bacterium]
MNNGSTGSPCPNNTKVGVLMGGVSKEREVSLRSGAAVSKALQKKGYEVVEIDVQVGLQGVQKIIDAKIDVAFIALHGRLGEDGAIQGFLEMLRVPYTGSGVLASALAMDKDFTKQIVHASGVRTPFWSVVMSGLEEKAIQEVQSFPVIVKPAQEGSTIGMSIVKNKEDLMTALKTSFQYDDKVLVEQFIQGSEVTVSVLNGKVLPIIQVVPKSGFYDFTSKYTKGMTEYIVPAPISQKLQERISLISERIFDAMSLSGCARMDFMIDHQEQEYFLEVNTLPGMTETSLVPKAAAATGMSFEDLCESILQTASLKEKVA